MKKIYLIPGWTETTKRRPYQKLAKIAGVKGYEVIKVKVDWNKKISEQIFKVEQDSIIFGFSLGAIFARLVAQENPCDHLILASSTPIDAFGKNREWRKTLVEMCGKKFIDDVEKNIKRRTKARKTTKMFGEDEYSKKEDGEADIIVLETGHELSDNYLKEVKKLL